MLGQYPNDQFPDNEGNGCRGWFLGGLMVAGFILAGACAALLIQWAL